jgi:predicted O-methyltransferase YrrM
MKTLNVITPVCRTENIPLLYDNISFYSSQVKIVWWLILDSSCKKQYRNISLKENENLKIKLLVSPFTNVSGGHAHRNIILDLLEADDEQWVYNLDDDNILHPGFIDFFVNDGTLNDFEVVLVSQITFNGTLRLQADINSIKVNHVDTAMCLFKMKALNGLRFGNDYCADGYFIESLYNNKNNRFYINNTPLCYYNYLKDTKYQSLNTVLARCPVPILQEEWEFATLLKLYRHLNPENVLEIGSFFGGTLWFWLNNSSRLDKVVSIDHPIPPSDGRYEEMIASKRLWNGWIKDTVSFTELQDDSTLDSTVVKVSNIFPEKNVDFLFIDGGHDYNTVRLDYDNYSKLVRRGGMIVFHDVVGLEEVKKCWNEVKTGKAYVEIYNGCGGWGVGIINVI